MSSTINLIIKEIQKLNDIIVLYFDSQLVLSISGNQINDNVIIAGVQQKLLNIDDL